MKKPSLLCAAIIFVLLLNTQQVFANAVMPEYFVDSTEKTMSIGDSIQMIKPLVVTQDSTERLFEKGITEYLYKLHHFRETVTFTLEKVEDKNYYFSYFVSYTWVKTDNTLYELPLHWYGLSSYWHNLENGTTTTGEFIAKDKTVVWVDEEGVSHNSLVYENNNENSIIFSSYRYRISPLTINTIEGEILAKVTLASGKNYSRTTGKALKQQCEWSLKNTTIRQNVTYIENYSTFQSKRTVMDYCYGEEKYTVRKARCYLIVKDYESYVCPRDYRCHLGACIPQEEYDAIGVHAVMYEPSVEQIKDSWTSTPQDSPPPRPPYTPGEDDKTSQDDLENNKEINSESDDDKGFFASIWSAIVSIFS